MEEILRNIIKNLSEKGKTIATMESCTGGALANEITSIEGASDVLKFSAVTYSNEYKIKMGVDSKLIDEFSVYSVEVAKDMSKKISVFANSDYGVGITGKLNRADKNNNYGKDNLVFVSIYDKGKDKYTSLSIEVCCKTRKENKQDVVNKIIYTLNTLI